MRQRSLWAPLLVEHVRWAPARISRRQSRRRLVISVSACVLPRVQRSVRPAEYAELSFLFFLHAMAMGAWFVPLGTVLDAHGFQAIKPYAFATSALAAFVSPLVFGAMADRHVAPVRVLRWLAVATGLSMALAATSIQFRAAPWVVLVD